MKICGEYGDRASDLLGNEKKGNGNNNNRKPRFNGECNNYGEKATGQLNVGWRRKREKITLKTLLWGAHYVEKSQKVTTNKTSNNGWDIAVSCHISHTQRTIWLILKNEILMQHSWMERRCSVG